MNKDIVIDSTIMCNSFLNNTNVSAELKCICRKIVFSFPEENCYRLVLDDSEKEQKRISLIEKEYRDNLSGIRDFEILVKQLYRKDKIVRVKPLDDETLHGCLIDNHFHEEEDHVFVFTALASGKTIISEDSDYGIKNDSKEYNKCSFRYLTEELGLSLFDARGFWEKEIGFLCIRD